MKLKLNEKLAKYEFNTSNFFENQFYFMPQDGCLRLSASFSILTNQNVTLIEIQKKMEDLGEKLKTHVSKISLGSRAKN